MLIGLHVAASMNHTPQSHDRFLNSRLGFSPTARNFISTYLETPPVLSGESAELLCAISGSSVDLGSRQRALAALASTAGDLFFWYWLARGDGFHLTNWLLTEFLEPLNSFSQGHSDRLRLFGGTATQIPKLSVSI